MLFPPAVNNGSPPIAQALGAIKSICDSRSQAQVVRSKQPAYSLALPAVCITVSRINQPLARWAVNYRGDLPNCSGTSMISFVKTGDGVPRLHPRQVLLVFLRSR